MFVRRSCWPFCEAFRRSQTLLFIWPVVILSRAIYKVLICINKKKKRKKCFLHSYHSVLLLIHSGIFNFNINIQFCYLLYIYIFVFSFFFFFFILGACKCEAVQEYRTVVLLFRNPKNKTTLSQWLFIVKDGFKFLAKLYPIYKTKQTKKREFKMDYSIFSHSHLHLVGCKTNGQRKMVLTNVLKEFYIINHKTLLEKKIFC